MPLKIIVIGAGIGGLCAAVALYRAGHEVKILERSRFLGEIGAALLLTPNGSCVLQELGFSFHDAQADQMTRWEVLDGITLATLAKTEVRDAKAKYGSLLYTIHRADLHAELLRILRVSSSGSQKAVELCLGIKVRQVDVDGTVELLDGARLHADLIIGADGVHSVTRPAVLDDDATVHPSGLSAFRFQIPTSTFKDDVQFRELLKVKGKGSTVLVDTKEVANERHLVWYDCHGGRIQNFVGIHSDRHIEPGALKEAMVQEFAHFHPSIAHIIQVATEVTDWPLPIVDAFPKWHKKRTVIIGDAAHPMLPFSGQGANQAIEDGGALGELFRDVHDPAEVPARLELFDSVRRLRASRVQALSQVRLGKEKEVESLVKQFADPTGDGKVPTSFQERYEHDFSFNVLEKCREVLKGHLAA